MKKRTFSLVIPVRRPDRETEMYRQITELAYPSYLVELLFIRGKNSPGKKRNLGARRAHNEYLVFFDDDLKLPVDLLTNLNNALEHDNVLLIRNDNTNLEQIGSQETIIYLVCIKKEIFFRVGGFNETLYPGEKIDLIHRLKLKQLPCMEVKA
ncbi:MAG: glycosyltransferase [Acidobacteria bacterium]|jgi:predicted glycosyltransferase involved in capsule biosynthesis|nr:glycosyltransferase [Acidobacteriota bacterium]